MRRPYWEQLVGDYHFLDYLNNEPQDELRHPMQELMEELVDTLLDDDEKQVFYMRFGERIPHRTIADEMGYKWHRQVQRIEERIVKKIRQALEERGVI